MAAYVDWHSWDHRDMPASDEGGSVFYRFTRRRDPHAPMLVMLHDDGENERSVSVAGRAMWPGAPVLRLRGSVKDRTGFRFLACEAAQVAKLSLEARVLDDISACVGTAVRTRDAALVEVIFVGLGGGADALAGILCRSAKGVTAAILIGPRRRWVVPPAARPSIGRIEVFIIPDGQQRPCADAIAGLLGERGAEVTLHEEAPTQASPVRLAGGWLRRVLRDDET